jgi:hypothetical protein
VTVRRLLLVGRVLIVLFALSSGAYKLAFGPADVEIYAHLGFSPVATAVFGGVQALFGLLCLPARTRSAGAVGLAGCNAVATGALFAAGIQPFGWASLVFVAMALVLLADRPS